MIYFKTRLLIHRKFFYHNSKDGIKFKNLLHITLKSVILKMTDGEHAETRCIALSGSDREGSAVVRDKPFPTRRNPKHKNRFYKR